MDEDIWVKWGGYEAWIEHLAGDSPVRYEKMPEITAEGLFNWAQSLTPEQIAELETEEDWPQEKPPPYPADDEDDTPPEEDA